MPKTNPVSTPSIQPRPTPFGLTSLYSEMFLRDHRIACDQELKELVHEWLANLAKNNRLGARRFFTTGLLLSGWGRAVYRWCSYTFPIDVALILREPYFSVFHSNWRAKNEIVQGNDVSWHHCLEVTVMEKKKHILCKVKAPYTRPPRAKKGE
jgi:hypothetical protein